MRIRSNYITPLLVAGAATAAIGAPAASSQPASVTARGSTQCQTPTLPSPHDREHPRAVSLLTTTTGSEITLWRRDGHTTSTAELMVTGAIRTLPPRAELDCSVRHLPLTRAGPVDGLFGAAQIRPRHSPSAA